MKNIRSSQPSIQWIFVLNSVKHMSSSMWESLKEETLPEKYFAIFGKLLLFCKSFSYECWPFPWYIPVYGINPYRNFPVDGKILRKNIWVCIFSQRGVKFSCFWKKITAKWWRNYLQLVLIFWTCLEMDISAKFIYSLAAFGNCS